MIFTPIEMLNIFSIGNKFVLLQKQVNKTIIMKSKIIILACLCLLCTANAQEYPTYWWRCVSGDATFNFHPAATARGGIPALTDSVNYSSSFTMVVVYHSQGDTAERNLWNVGYADGGRRGLTTRRILSDTTYITYADENLQGPVINTLQQSAPHHGSSTLPTLVAGDTTGRIKVAEVMCFEGKIGMGALRRVQSYLAVKYGVTLGPVNYVDGHGNVFWSHADNEAYHHRITAIGRDSTYGLSQLRSRSEHDSATVTLSADSLQEGGFLACGDDGQPMSLAMDPYTGANTLQRTWKLCAMGAEGTLFGLAFDGGRIQECDTLALIYDGTPFMPDSIRHGMHYYGNIPVYADSVIFTFADAADFAEGMAMVRRPNEKGFENERISVYPNPTTGRYHIEVQGASRAEAHIYTLQGSMVAHHEGDGQNSYRFEGTLPTGSSYYVTVTTPGGKQTTKLIVK